MKIITKTFRRKKNKNYYHNNLEHQLIGIEPAENGYSNIDLWKNSSSHKRNKNFYDNNIEEKTLYFYS